jgi:DNA transposition AAA+ family ATPase
MPDRISGYVDIGEVMKTRGFNLTQAVAQSTLDHTGISLFYGAPGLGKTVAVRNFAAGVVDQPIYYSVAADTCTLYAFAVELTEVVTGLRNLHLETTLSLKRILREVLCNGRPAVLIVDETQRIGLHIFEFLRDLHDHESAAFTLLLVGNDQAWTVIQSRPMLKSRLLHTVHFERLSDESIVPLLPHYHSLYKNADQEVLKLVATKSLGEFRWLAKFTLVATDICKRAGATTLTVELATAALFAIARGGVVA